MVERIQLFPEPISLENIIPFIMEYIRRHGMTSVFVRPADQLELAQQVLRIVEVGGGEAVTPLLISLFVEAARSWRMNEVGAEIPVSIPEVYLTYLKRLSEGALDSGLVMRAATLLAKLSLGTDFIPKDFSDAAALDALNAEEALAGGGATTASNLILRWFYQSSLVRTHEVAGIFLLRFEFDPVAEFLVAIDVCRRNGSNANSWAHTIDCLREIDGYPASLQGFLSALRVTYLAYREPLKLPTFEFPWS